MAANWEFRHLAIIVRDIDKAAKYYESLGLGSPRPEFMLDSSQFTDYKVNGKKPGTVDKTRMKIIQIGSFAIELVQPVSGEPIYKAFLEKQGEGPHHNAYSVDNLAEETAKLEARGAKTVLEAKLASGAAFSYFDTGEPGGLLVELIQVPKR